MELERLQTGRSVASAGAPSVALSRHHRSAGDTVGRPVTWAAGGGRRVLGTGPAWSCHLRVAAGTAEPETFPRTRQTEM